MISAENAYNNQRDTFTTIPTSSLLTPKMSRDDTIGEAEELKIVALEDKDVLVQAGCPAEFIDSLEERIGAYAHASSIWENSEFEKSESKKLWIEKEGPAYDFKYELLHNLRFALRKDADALKYVSKISEGRGKRDLVVDLLDIAVLGKQHSAALDAIGFDAANLDKAKAMHDELSDLLSSANMNPDDLAELKTQSYQAYTYLQEAVSEIREIGQFVFWKDPVRLDLYKSDYYQGVGKIKNKIEVSEIPA